MGKRENSKANRGARSKEGGGVGGATFARTGVKGANINNFLQQKNTTKTQTKKQKTKKKKKNRGGSSLGSKRGRERKTLNKKRGKVERSFNPGRPRGTVGSECSKRGVSS